ncbi:oligosaccharide flippase family protein [Shewanella vesiculosa]|uniref:oligosaccharide flippase family protein n=1 Tax=Shewanella vesiculosa TaxID=518738 RepID=UPI003D060E51
MSLILKNIIALYGVQLIRMILPLLMLPILTSRFSEHDFGLYIYTISIAMWLSLLVEFGFNISATKMISQQREGEEVSSIIVKTQSAKIIVCFFVTILIPISYFFIPVFENEPSWILTMFLVGVFTGMIPQYYFQGTEDLKGFGFIECASGALLFFSVYFFAKGDAATEILMLCLVLSRLFSLTVLTTQMYLKVKESAKKVNILLGIEQLKAGLSIFYFQLIASFYTIFNIIFLGFFVPVLHVAIYGAAERIIRSGLGFISQASNVMFPRINSLKSNGNVDLKKVKLITLFSFTTLGFLGCFLINSLSFLVIPWLFSGKYDQSIELVNIMAWVIPAIALSNVLAFQYLLVDGLERTLNKVVTFAGVLNLFVAYAMIETYGYIGMAFTWVLLEWGISIFLGCLIYYRHHSKLN